MKNGIWKRVSERPSTLPSKSSEPRAASDRSPDLCVNGFELPSQRMLSSGELLEPSALTVAGPCRSFTGFPKHQTRSLYVTRVEGVKVWIQTLSRLA
jgi:hypothetical protein